MKSDYLTREYKLKILTPLLIHGDQKEYPELRISTIKGIMHYWWRALQYASNTSDLRENEVKIFGGATIKSKYGKMSNGKKSPVSIRILKHPNEITKENILSHRDHPKYDGHNFRGTRISGFRSGGEFSLVFIAPASEKETLAVYTSLFEFSTMVSGFGQRMRRGYGAIQITDHSWENVDYYLHSLKEKIILLNLHSNLESAVRIEDHTLMIAKDKYESCPYPVVKRIYIGKTHSIGEKASTYQSIPQMIGMASHHFNKKKNIGNFKPRLASPLHASVVKIGGQLVPVLTEVHNPDAHIKAEHDINNFITFIMNGGKL